MLKFGNTYLNFGGTYLKDWDSIDKPKQICSKIWMTKNLDVNDGQGGIYVIQNVTPNGVDLGTQYYYTWAAAVRVANSIQGWHLPSQEEYADLIGCQLNVYENLKSSTGWNTKNGFNRSGFNAYPVGWIKTSEGTPVYVGTEARFWTSTTTEYDNTQAYYMGLDDNESGYILSEPLNKQYRALTIRLVKD